MRAHKGIGRRVAVLGALMVAGFLWVSCSSAERKPIPAPSTQDVRGHADRAFDQLKQEEQQRGASGQQAR